MWPKYQAMHCPQLFLASWRPSLPFSAVPSSFSNHWRAPYWWERAWICCCWFSICFQWSGIQKGKKICWWELVFTGSVLWTKKIHRTKLNWTVVQSIFRLQLPKFGVILVASCLISKIIQNCSKTGWNQLQPVKWSRALHSLAMSFITFNLIFGSSKTVKNC